MKIKSPELKVRIFSYQIRGMIPNTQVNLFSRCYACNERIFVVIKLQCSFEVCKNFISSLLSILHNGHYLQRNLQLIILGTKYFTYEKQINFFFSSKHFFAKYNPILTMIFSCVGENGIVCIIFGIPNKGINIRAALTLFLKRKKKFFFCISNLFTSRITVNMERNEVERKDE